MTMQEFGDTVNMFAARGTPFFFLIDFEKRKPFVCKLDEARKNDILYDLKGNRNYANKAVSNKPEIFRKIPVAKEKYRKGFSKIQEHINHGDTYLVNLTFPTKIETDMSLDELFFISRAPYKLLYKKEFIVFSPECFVRIDNERIFSYPMKGTIDASVPDAEQKLLGSKKELYEHNTIVDLIRNDLSIIAEDVEVKKFRYIDKIRTNHRDLLQVSSEITGRLPGNWKNNLADILTGMLPAGSISGAPKKKTVEIIKDVEKADRGYFTGIFGIFDGAGLESAVNIRYIERSAGGLRFRSGGGITALSEIDSEFNEMINKVYVPTG